MQMGNFETTTVKNIWAIVKESEEWVDSLPSLLRIFERENLSRGGFLLSLSLWFVILTPVHGDLLRSVPGLDSGAPRSSRRKHPGWVLAVLMAFSRGYPGSLSSASLVLSFSPSIDFLFGQKVRVRLED
ncbi:hypothetical protein Bca4012_047521 [Brassica carinata]